MNTEKMLDLLTKQFETALQTEPEEPEEPKKPKVIHVTAETGKKFEKLLGFEKLGPEDLSILTGEEKRIFFIHLDNIMRIKEGEDLDNFLEKTEAVMSHAAKQSIRQRNHIKICSAIATLVRKQGRMPTRNELVYKTGLSRVTIQKHLTEYPASVELKARIEEYQLMKGIMMDRVMQAGLDGNIKAAKLFMETADKMAGLEKTSAVINQQNNYIQLNGVTVNLQQLPVELVKQIEEFVSGSLGRKE